MSYLIGGSGVGNSNVAIPVSVRHQLNFTSASQGNGRLDITVSPKQTMGRTVEGVKIEVPMPKSVLNCTLTSTQGKYTFDPVSKVLAWDLGKVDSQKPPNIHGTINLQSGAPIPDSNPSINISFLINQMAVSGLKVILNFLNEPNHICKISLFSKIGNNKTCVPKLVFFNDEKL